MGSPHLMGLGFLLLAIAAPCPNVAMASDHPAERTHDSSSGKTTVTVYCCKDCEISKCETGSFERFIKIAETENEVFSNGIIDLVTGETHILMCFQQANTFPEGIYGIFWIKPGGLGHSCAILNSTAFPENERGSNSMEENKICCKAETNVWKSSSTLNCYPEMSSAESRKSTADNPGKEIPSDPELSTSSIFLISLPFFVLCAAVLTIYCYWRHSTGKVLQPLGNINRLQMRRASLV
ncbi:uncharacterized protein LOC126641961 [Myiozetetes cayanensis]|uniref:uncharacterized protein LOC126641961 n=1 Tax=Myiozetetes cayanensis TaxID=478635 RepID=UPI00215E3A66|nr:uncharacterized protein LOC126641961 [Myiozetetes cayanensis]XP_050175111.1 uncharacterized protein LOC126641961 [Myiozetetes cayanensis]